ncbi:MAG: recombinase family protein, partial [Ruminococcus sp.]|nr:recombinase family protein [Ruminococcus sp.]
TVIVKDMLRFGRNYLLVGQYLEIVFPAHNVRFIAVSDNVDSANGMSDMMPFHNIMNEWYARDISRKVRAVIQNKGNNGERTTTNAIYGYKKDPNDSKKWIIDEPAAQIVRRIFDMYISGMGFSEISKTFTAEKILRPTAYLGYKIGVHCEDFEEYFWHYSTIRSILRHQEYCGDTINFRTCKISYKAKKKINNPKEKQKVFCNTHDPIISREKFNEAQLILNSRKRRVPMMMNKSIYFDYLFCGTCKHPMRINRTKVKSKNKGEHIRKVYLCSLSTKKTGACTTHLIHESLIDEYVIEQINNLLRFAKIHKKEFEEMLRISSDGKAKAEFENVKSEMESIQKRLSEIDMYIQSLFESKIKGEIDSGLFGTLSEKYRAEKSELNTKLEELVEKEVNLKNSVDRSVKLGTSVNKYDIISEGTPEVLRDFIERIEIGDKTGEKIGSTFYRRIAIFHLHR